VTEYPIHKENFRKIFKKQNMCGDINEYSIRPNPTPLTRFARYNGRRLCLNGMALMLIHFRDITVNFEEMLNRFGKKSSHISLIL